MSPDPSDALDPGVGFNRYAYVRNNPVSLVDPSGFIVESGWDAFNVGLGIASAISNIAAGNYLDAAIDAVGVVADLAATAVPGVPGGVGAAIQATRTAKTVEKVVDKVVDASKLGKGPAGEAAETAAGKVDEAADAASAARGGPPPNNGIGPPHGGPPHNKAIDQRVDKLKTDPEVSNIRKNQQQVDVDGNKVGNNRPDIQYDKNGTHCCIEYDTVPSNSRRHGDTIRQNDPDADVELNTL